MRSLDFRHVLVVLSPGARFLLTVLLLLCAGVTTSTAASAEGPQPINDRGQTLNFIIARDEIVQTGGETGSQLLSVPANATVADTIAQARNLEQTTGAAVQLVLYPDGAPRNEWTRRYLTRKVLVRLTEGADPLDVRRATGANYDGELTYAPGYHLYSFLDAGDSLLLAPGIRQVAGVLSAEPLLARKFSKRLVPTDTFFTNQWHLMNIGQNAGSLPGIDINVTNVWEAFRGSNIVVAVVDDGLELAHEDITNNLATGLHLDVNAGDTDPSPGSPFDGHGTAVGGIIGAEANNSSGVAGIAFESKLAGIRLLGGLFSDAEEGQALSHRLDAIHVSNNSWGPADNGQLHRIGPLASNAIYQGIVTGRGGRGAIYVWAGGNGGSAFVRDNSNYDAWANQIYTISVGALGDDGIRADYSEPGANVVIMAPSEGNGRPGIVTTDLMSTNGYNNGLGGDTTNANYTFNFNGTSAASPVAAGGIALLLNANTNLGWRDVQEILIRTATQVDTNNTDWATNAAGFTFNHEYGAGLINVGAAVQMATNNWTNLPVQTNLTVALTNLDQSIPDAFTSAGQPTLETPLTNTLTVSGENIRVEHVQLRVSLTALPTAFLEIKLRSPSGMESVMLDRLNTTTNNGLDFTFMSVRHWGEFAEGDWEVIVTDTQPGQNGILNDVELTVWGSPTNAVALNVPPSIRVGGNPKTKAVTKGSAAFFRVLADGTPPLSYQWRFTDLQGVTRDVGSNSPSLFLNDVDASKQGIYVVDIFNQFGNARSGSASLFVNSPPEITNAPTSKFVILGGSVTNTVQAIGNLPLGYQWRQAGIPLPGATSPTLILTNLQQTNLGFYDVIVSNTLASVISQPILLSLAQGVAFTNAVPTLTNGVFAFSFSGTTGQTVRIDISEDLLTWTNLDTRVMTDGTASVTDPGAGARAARYYRVVPLP